MKSMFNPQNKKKSIYNNEIIDFDEIYERKRSNILTKIFRKNNKKLKKEKLKE